jgi:short-subunit dehydrogenase
MPGSKLALITGASSGIGAEFARQLAARNYNLILTARRQENLRALADTLNNRNGIHVECLPADLATDSGRAIIVDRIRDLPRLDLLVNNAGFGLAGKFFEGEDAKIASMLNVHILASVMFTHAALPGMIAHKQGSIINVASMAGLIPVRSVLYGSTKAFLINFSKALQDEVSHAGVRVMALCPGFTYTEFHDTAEYSGFRRQKIPRILWLTAEEVVNESFNCLEKKKVVCIPGFQYKIIALIAENRLIGYFVHLIGSKLFHK